MLVLYKHGEYHSHSKNHGPRPPPQLWNLQRRKVLHMFSKVRLREYPVVGTQSLGDASCPLWVAQSCGTLGCWSMQHLLQGSVPGSPGEAAELQGCHTTTGLLKCSYCLAAPGIRHIHDMSVMLKSALLKPLFFGNLHVCAWCLMLFAWGISAQLHYRFCVSFPPFSPQLHSPNTTSPMWCTLDATAIGNMLIDKMSTVKMKSFW